MNDTACPACGEPVENFEPRGPVTYVLQPCGHQVDDRTCADLVADANEGSSSGTGG